MHSQQTTTADIAKLTGESGPLWLPLACGWLLMFVTFSLPDRGGSVIGSLDGIAVAKVSVRLLVIASLGFTWFHLWQRRRRLIVMKWFFPFAAFAGWAFLSTSWSPLKMVSFGQAMSLLSLLMLAITYGLVCRSDRDISTILMHVAWGLAAVSGLVLFLYFCVPQAAALQRGEADGLFHPTNSAATASLGLVVLIGTRLIWNWRWTRILLLPGIMLHLAVLGLAVNRLAPVLTLVVLVGMFLLFAGRAALLGSVLFLCTTGALYLTLDPGLSLIGDAAASTTTVAVRGQSGRQLLALSGREELWELMWDSFLESPWRGHGYFVTSSTGVVKVWNSKGNRTAHNVLLQLLATTGLIGIFLFSLGLILPVWAILKELVQLRGNTSFAGFGAALACWYVGWGLLNSSITGPLQPESVVFFTVLGLAVGLAMAHRTDRLHPNLAATSVNM
jgi:O-antigen ligase